MQKLVVAMSGASGAIYSLKLLQYLNLIPDIEVHLVVSEAAEINLSLETGLKLQDLTKLVHTSYQVKDISAAIASGSFKTSGMLIIPCSTKTLAAIASGYIDNLISRAAEVHLKERRKLILCVRESPLNLLHIRNMLTVTEAGGIIAPLTPSFYSKPSSIDELIKFMLGRILDLLDIEINIKRWQGIEE